MTINYNYRKLGMQNLKVRQEHFKRAWDFTCCCGLCQEEEIKNDDEIYEKFQKLQEDVQKAGLKVVETGIQNLDDMDTVFSCYEEMCVLAKNKKAPKFFILDILEEGFWCGLAGHLLAEEMFDLSKLKKFKGGCEKFSKIGEIISKIAYGEDHSVAKDWKERNQNFENWLSKYKKSHDDVNQF